MDRRDDGRELPEGPLATSEDRAAETAAVEEERDSLQQRISDWLDVPLAVLSLMWTALLIVELAFTLSPEASNRVSQASLTIWFVFALAFFFEFAIAPNKIRYLRRNFLSGISVVLPFVRVVRVVRVVRLLRSVSLVRIVLLSNRATKALAQLLSEHQFQYIFSLVAIITVVGAAGVYFFERDLPGTPFYSLGEALWWAATMVTTMNVGAEPATAEGRIIALLLRVVAVGLFGYVAGSIASYLIGHRTGEPAQVASEREAIQDLAKEIAMLRAAVERRETQVQPSEREEGPDRSESA